MSGLWFVLGDGFYGLEAVSALRENFHLRVRLDQFAENHAREVFIVNDEGSDLLLGRLTQFLTSGMSNGKDKFTRKIPFSVLTRMFASLP
jgi:hypothetical protein